MEKEDRIYKIAKERLINKEAMSARAKGILAGLGITGGLAGTGYGGYRYGRKRGAEVGVRTGRVQAASYFAPYYASALRAAQYWKQKALPKSKSTSK